MFPIVTKLREDRKKLTGLTAREFNRRLKWALRLTMGHWHRTYAPLHFKRVAYARYPEDYRQKKKAPAKPLVETGSLRGRILSKIEIRGTSRRMSGAMRYGRPGQATEDLLRRRAFIEMKLHPGITHKQAQRRVYSNLGYSAKMKRVFQRQIASVNPQEEKAMAGMVEDLMTQQMNKSGGKRTRTIR